LGIIIGVASVVLLTAFGLGLKQYISDQFDSLGTNLIYVLPGQVFNQSGGFRSSFAGSVSFDEKDLVSLKKINSLSYVVPNLQKSITIDSEGKTEIATLNGSSHEVFLARNLIPKEGRVYDKTDIDKKNKVVVLGSEIAEKLFEQPGLAIDKKIRIEDQAFKVIGVLESKGGGGFGGPNFDKFAYIPYKTGFILTGQKVFNSMVLKVKENESIEQTKEEVRETMLKRYEEDDFTVADSKEFINTIQSIFSILNSVLIAIGAVSLVVGGIGIMNIMYVSVTERIKEIGIRRSIGAMEKDILLQFLAESVLLSLLGGILGLILSYILILGVSFFFPAYIDLNSVVLAIVVSSGIGIFFGVFPARKAANLSPIEAIRYE